jgi:hypothetical protein
VWIVVPLIYTSILHVCVRVYIYESVGIALPLLNEGLPHHLVHTCMRHFFSVCALFLCFQDLYQLLLYSLKEPWLLLSALFVLCFNTNGIHFAISNAASSCREGSVDNTILQCSFFFFLDSSIVSCCFCCLFVSLFVLLKTKVTALFYTCTIGFPRFPLFS